MPIAPAENALTTVARLRAAGYGGSATDDQLQLAINAVSAAVERACQRSFKESVFTEEPEDGELHPELVQGTGLQEVLLSTYPILEVTKVTVDGVEVDDWQLLPGQAAWGALHRRRGWPSRQGHWGGLVCDPDGELEFNIEVSYRGGFAKIPADLEFAVMQETDTVVNGISSDRNIKSERTPGGWSVTYQDQTHEFSLSSRSVFQAYKRELL